MVLLENFSRRSSRDFMLLSAVLSQVLYHQFIGIENPSDTLLSVKGWLCKTEKKMPTAPGIPRRSPIQVLTRLNIA